MTKHNSLATYLRFALVASVCWLNSPQTFAMTVNSAVAIGPQLTITGAGFSGTPLSVIFNGSPITINSSTSTQIVATINRLPLAGTYRVVVKAGTASSTVYVTLSNIVAKVSLLNQAAAIPLTTLWTPILGGVYRVSIYMVQVPPFPSSGSAQTGGVSVGFEWTDDAGAQSQFSGIFGSAPVSLTLYDSACGGAPPACPPVGLPGAILVLQVQGGTPIQYRTTYRSNQGAPEYYDLFMTLEKI